MAHDINAVKKCLKDAGLYEENMDPKVMMEYYNAIKNSESTATAEDEGRKSKEEAPPQQAKEQPEKEEDGLQLEESDAESEKPAPKSAKAKKEVVNFSDMPACKEKMLDVIHHEPKYFLAIDFNSDEYAKLSLSQKVGLLFKYHTNLSKQVAAIARRSIHSAPRPKDITSSPRFNGTLLRGGYDNYDYTEQSDTSIYTSRSGRQTKRKKYNEDFDFDDELTNKKQKSDAEWTAGKNKAGEKKNTSLTQTTEAASSSTVQDGAKDIPSSSTDSTILDTPTSSKAENVTPLARRANLKKLTNEDIIKRSSLFSPISMKRSRPEPKTRSELLFDKLKEEEKKRQLAEKEAEIFERSLKEIDLEDSTETSNVANTTNDTPNVSKRISARRMVNARKRLTPEFEDADSTNKVAKNASKSIGNRSFLRSTTVLSDIDLDAIETEATLDQPMRSTKIDCPLCGVGYPEEDIQAHAATCCEPIDTSQSQITLRSTVKS